MGEGTELSELTALQREGLARLEACAREGVTIRAYARRRRLSEHKLYQLGKVLRAKGVLPPATRGGSQAPPRVRATRKARFVEVKPSTATHASSDTSPPAWRARLPNGVVIEGSSDLDRAVEALAKL